MHNEDQLRSYLAWAIHGRKPQRRATSPTRKGPPRDKTYLAWIREMPCIACGVEGRSVAAHTGTDGGMSQKASDYSCVPLCADCHTQAPGAYHRAGRGTFERRHGLSFAGAVARLNREWQAPVRVIWQTCASFLLRFTVYRYTINL
jgi:hypothetical protein